MWPLFCFCYYVRGSSVLSYRHAFHAGNFADVLKHHVLVHVLSYMNRKDKPYVYVDTHSGAGVYSLRSASAGKNREYENGIGRLTGSDSAALQPYLKVVAGCEQFGAELYPGSPEIARQLLREQDRGFLYELHPSDSAILADHFAPDRRFRIEQSDGFRGLLAHMPPQQRRGVVLMDPPYEVKTDYEQVVSAMLKAHKRFSTGTYMIWYPVVERSRIDAMERAIIASGIARVQLFELGLSADTEERGMTSSGMIVVNPPYTLKAEMDSLLPWLCRKLSDDGCWRSVELAGEGS